MQQLTINIPDNKIAFFIDLAKNLGFTIESTAQKNTSIPDKKPKGKASELRGKMSPMTNEQIDQQFNSMREDNNRHENILTDKQIDLMNEARKNIKENPGHFLDWDDTDYILSNPAYANELQKRIAENEQKH